jgi:hypothetical protein
MFIAEEIAVFLEDFHTKGMEGTSSKIYERVTGEHSYSTGHFGCCFIGEGEG